ncbi:MAG: hypothetical protein DI549_10835 [Ancylobacter novellus]|uniref:Uncharacterized protein n=1 Tax=Ancylobacter novellus TaxID=921 RepID=A0A2W5QZ57_ANCNO|nr:MAG: hypothetical protein DI549_10835 [Ancylobacter novellus]
MATALTQADIDALERLLVSGEQSVRLSDGREIRYQDASAMLKALAYARGAISAANPTTAATPSTYAQFERE